MFIIYFSLIYFCLVMFLYWNIVYKQNLVSLLSPMQLSNRLLNEILDKMLTRLQQYISFRIYTRKLPSLLPRRVFGIFLKKFPVYVLI